MCCIVLMLAQVCEEPYNGTYVICAATSNCIVSPPYSVQMTCDLSDSNPLTFALYVNPTCSFPAIVTMHVRS